MAEKYLRNVRFLIVDDTSFVRHTVRMVLKQMGSEHIQEAADGADALRQIGVFMPDIIILNWEMKPVNGIEFARKIRGRGDTPYSFIPIIMLTGHADEERVATARDAGVNEFVVKPFSANGLFSRIQAVIERPRSFIKVESYFGPDRRRKMIPMVEGQDRRGKSADETFDDDGSTESNESAD
jgi:DNA-binding response OmpR family regulator